MTDFSDMLSKAKAMQEKMKEAQDQIKKIEVEADDPFELDLNKFEFEKVQKREMEIGI